MLPLEGLFNLLFKITELCVENFTPKNETIKSLEFLTDSTKSLILPFNENSENVENFNGSYVKYCQIESEICQNFCGIGNKSCLAEENSCLIPDETWTCSLNGMDSDSSFYFLYGEKCSKIKEEVTIL